MLNFNLKINIIFYSLLHFLVDGLCSLVIWARLYKGDSNASMALFLIYNILAFCTQPIFGLFIDRFKNKEKLFLLISVLCLILGVVFSFEFITSAILLGFGNSIFHIAGGKYVIDRTKNDIVSLGIFVAPGALGLVIGKYVIHLATWITFISLLVIFTIFLLLAKDVKEKEDTKQININNNLTLVLLFMIILVVLFRAFIGGFNFFTFDKSFWVLILMGATTMVGKMLGGILSKYIGINIAIIVTMIISMICFMFFNNNLYLTMLGIILFNCSMPMTLYLANELFQNHEGFSFGILAAFLVPGYFLATLEYSELIAKILIAVFSILSILLIVISNNKINKPGDLI